MTRSLPGNDSTEVWQHVTTHALLGKLSSITSFEGLLRWYKETRATMPSPATWSMNKTGQERKVAYLYIQYVYIYIDSDPLKRYFEYSKFAKSFLSESNFQSLKMMWDGFKMEHREVPMRWGRQFRWPKDMMRFPFYVNGVVTVWILEI